MKGMAAFYTNTDPSHARLYGIPQKIGNKVISCPNNLFRRGENYFTVDIDEIQKILHGYSRDFLIDLIGVGPKTPFTPHLFNAERPKNQF